jgi:hypothetical protein
MLVEVQRDTDAAHFIARVDGIMTGSIRGLELPSVWIVRIDNFFDDRWFQFTGKVLGALGLARRDPLHVPPFHPHRVVSERFFASENGHYVEAPPPARLHISQHSEDNFKKDRRLSSFGGRAAFLWYSSASLVNGNAAAMSYVVDGENAFAWYATFSASADWRATHTVATDVAQLEMFERLASIDARHAGSKSALSGLEMLGDAIVEDQEIS